MQPRPHTVIVANGELTRAPGILDLLDRADLVIAADGGANWLVAQGRQPHVLVGDMDSVSPETLRLLAQGPCRIQRHSPHKDETDTELALLEALALGAASIHVLGALGGRIDHEIANVLLLAMPQLADIEVTLCDGRSAVRLAQHQATVRGQPGDTVSLIPIGGDAQGIETSGLQYRLRGESLLFGPARGVSNHLAAPEAHITWRQGRLLIVHTPQQEVDRGHGQ